MPDDTLEVHAEGTLDAQQLRDFTSAIHQARRAVDGREDERAKKAEPAGDAWQLATVAGRLVLHRCEGRGQRCSIELAPVTPRKPASCEVCKVALVLGVKAWKAVKLDWTTATTKEEREVLRKWPGHTSVASDTLAKVRVCAGCVERLLAQAVPAQPAAAEVAWPVRGLEC